MACMYGYTDLWIDFLREFEIEEALETVVHGEIQCHHVDRACRTRNAFHAKIIFTCLSTTTIKTSKSYVYHTIKQDYRDDSCILIQSSH